MNNSFFLLILFFYQSSFAQWGNSSRQILTTTEEPEVGTGSIKGRVSTQDGQPAAYVSVLLKGTSKGTFTHVDGTYFLRNVKEGNYTLITQFVGLQRQEKPITVLGGQTTELDFMLVETARQLAEVVITSQQSVNEKPVGIGKIAIRPMELPQSVAVIDRNVLERQQVLRLSDALMNVTGVYLMGATGGYQEEIAGRGFSFGNSNTFKNGARYFNGALPEMSSLERVEIMKGSSAILFGNVAAGGILNLVTKKPRFDRGGEVSMRVGSFGFYKPILDLYGSVFGSQSVAFRINGSYENARSFRDEVKSERIYVNPSLLFKLGDKTSLLLEGDYLKDNRTADFGTGAINYTIADIPRNRFLGTPWSYFRIEQKSANATLTRQLGKAWQLRAVGAYRSYTSDLFGTTRPNAGNFVRPDGRWIRSIQRSQTSETYYLGQVDVTGQMTTGFLKHNLLFGTDADQYNTRTTAYNNLAVYDTINIFNPTAYRPRTDVPMLTPRTLTSAPISRFGMYAQDLLSVAEKLKILVGVRYSYQQTTSNVLTFADSKSTESSTFDGAFTPRFGLVYQPLKTTSLFASYSNSFTLNTGIDVAGNALPPSFINQYEVGVKNELFNGLLSANVTAYRIVNSNLAQTSLANGNTNSNIRELAGEVTSKGLEIDLVSKSYKGVSVTAGYSFNETRYTKSNIYVLNSLLRYNPNHTTNASVYYVFQNKALRGLNLGLTALYTGDRVAGRSTRLTVNNDTYKLMPLAGFTQLDASAGYVRGNVSVRVKVANLFNELSYYIHDDNSVNPIAPRNFSATVAYKF